MDCQEVNIFETLENNSKIFNEREVLRPSYCPKNLPHRDEQVKTIATILMPALMGEESSNILIFGKTGTGKTATAKMVTSQLIEHSNEKEKKCVICYINCEIVDTQYRTLAYILNHFGREVPITGWPTDQLYQELIEEIDSRQQNVVIVLDEVDKLVRKSGDALIYNFTRMNNNLKKAKVSIIGISNDLGFTDQLDARVRSSLGQEEIIFPPYNADQLNDILQKRASSGFLTGVLGEGVIPLCAALGARDHGDARRALDLLRVAGEIAEHEKSPKVTEKNVKSAYKKIERDSVVEAIRTLPVQHQMVLFCISTMVAGNGQKIYTGSVYNFYRRLCRLIEIEYLTDRRVSDIISELDTLGLISARLESRGRYGRSKEISILPEPGRVREVILENYRLGELRGIHPPVQQRF